MKRSGIKDVAAAAGVSVATASYVLSGTGRPSEATRKRVLAAADALGFIRDASAARLRTGKSNLVGVILNNIINPFFSELVASLEATVYEAGGLTLLATAQNDPVRQEQLLASMVAQGVGSVILSPVHGSTLADLAPVLAHKLPLVLCVRDVPGSQAAFVGVDDEKSGYLAARCLLEAGHRSMVFIGGYPHTTTWDGRCAGIRQALADTGLPEEACRLVPGLMHPDFAEEKMLLLASQGMLPNAVICFNDDQASGAYRASRKLGMTVGRDIAILGFDNIPQGRILEPELTTVDIRPALIGQMAAELALRWADSTAAPAPHHRLEPILVRRKSVISS
ncbi:LacI family DNA-binding transcriptional regulator [Shinella zoogloeoides]|uniref:LacI family DNA-binding transcriptional regulator n=1 Tax=Shinella zoogloeoides TaxID=352475 RepID=UPI0028A679FC|nr:substrate-binding domain-containing protein [Shinella zoogloeoides]